MKALPPNAWSNRGRREDIKTEYLPGDVYRYQAIQGEFPTTRLSKPTNPLFHLMVVYQLCFST